MDMKLLGYNVSPRKLRSRILILHHYKGLMDCDTIQNRPRHAPLTLGYGFLVSFCLCAVTL
jgi:hypothetical protein